ncbi:MAG: Hsp20/alpha crystallin family protein [Limnochordaceae bacterium]|nr:Hsp20/alpha crystallin family protein [Limnochordaceae bacterium]
MPLFGGYWPARRRVGARRLTPAPVDFAGWLEKMFQDPFGFFMEGGLAGPAIWNWAGWSGFPAVDVQESDDAYVVKADLPGFTKEAIEILVHDEGLELRGKQDEVIEQQDERGGYLRQERRTGSFQRFIPFPGPVVEDQIKAQFENGVLTITLPKASPGPAGRRISID